MAHGAGGKASRKLVEGVFVPAFANAALDALGDAAVVDIGGAGVAVTTDAFVVTPIRFPGGSIGELAVNGTVNDLAVVGRPAGGRHGQLHPRRGRRRRRRAGRGRGDGRRRGGGRRGDRRR